ncbi:hypothetical protein HYALB_00010312 [Hymenoscyphus albidus]|uniref:Uncharacterized protein n=1 Tax=Hymenoscyphus albidus TaxID=595503 RepID=A0A9N9LY03_9HELO|nr:hypothetical protein HYALB_00010312 [Hymenoscyphus albidus]
MSSGETPSQGHSDASGRTAHGQTSSNIFEAIPSTKQRVVLFLEKARIEILLFLGGKKSLAAQLNFEL